MRGGGNNKGSMKKKAVHVCVYVCVHALILSLVIFHVFSPFLKGILYAFSPVSLPEILRAGKELLEGKENLSVVCSQSTCSGGLVIPPPPPFMNMGRGWYIGVTPSVCHSVRVSGRVRTISPEPLNHFFFTNGMVGYYHEVVCHAEIFFH